MIVVLFSLGISSPINETIMGFTSANASPFSANTISMIVKFGANPQAAADIV